MSPGPAASAPESRSKTGQESVGRAVLKRAILGLLLLFVMVSSSAWLLHSGIGAEAEPAEDEVAVSVPSDQMR